ncbi:MAG: lysophospholipid acyltransferase family protein [Lentilitoribacter sp.]
MIGLTVKSKRMPDWLANGIGSIFNHLFGFSQFNLLYDRLPEHNAMGLSNAFLDKLNIDLKVSGEPASSIPESGPVILMGNHPYGLLDGMVMDCILTEIRTDSVLMGFYALGQIPEYTDRLILVDPLKKRSRQSLNIKSWRQAFRLMSGGGALIVFPAGSVSHFQWKKKSVADPEWNAHIATLARKTGATVLPVYLHGHNGWLFQLCGMISPKLQNLFIFKEFPKMKNRQLEVTLGKAMPPEAWSDIDDDTVLINHFRKQVDALGRK